MKGRGSSISTVKYLGPVLALVVVLVGIHTWTEARRTRRDMEGLMTQQGMALAEALEISSRNAVAGNNLLEDMVGQRLMDNARLIDRLIEVGQAGLRLLPAVARENRLHRVEIRDFKGDLIADNRSAPPETPPPSISAGPPMMGMMGEMMRRRREGVPPPGPPSFSPPIGMMREHMQFFHPIIEGKQEEAWSGFGEKKFWRGPNYGVAVKRRHGSGIIVIVADANYILNFRKEIGIQRLARDLEGTPGIKYVQVQDRELKYLAHADPAKLGESEPDPFLTGVLKDAGPAVRRVNSKEGTPVLEVARPFSLAGSPIGVIRVGISLEPLELMRRKSIAAIALIAGALVAAGVFGVVAIFINQRRELRAEREREAKSALKERLASMGNLAAGVAHEIRNPLNAISMGLQRLRQEFQPREGAREFAELTDLIRGEVKRLNGIVDGFLKLARPMRPQLVPCNIVELINDVAALISGDAESRGVAVVVKLPPRLPSLRADSKQLKQAVMNIMLNGIQAMEGGGTLNLTAAVRGDEVAVKISDTGPGIAPDVKGRIFEPYFTGKEGGTGLGLTIAQGIVQEHGGRIEVESKPGIGTTFTITLPVGRGPEG